MLARSSACRSPTGSALPACKRRSGATTFWSCTVSTRDVLTYVLAGLALHADSHHMRQRASPAPVPWTGGSFARCAAAGTEQGQYPAMHRRRPSRRQWFPSNVPHIPRASYRGRPPRRQVGYVSCNNPLHWRGIFPPFPSELEPARLLVTCFPAYHALAGLEGLVLARGLNLNIGASDSMCTQGCLPTHRCCSTSSCTCRPRGSP